MFVCEAADRKRTEGGTPEVDQHFIFLPELAWSAAGKDYYRENVNWWLQLLGRDWGEGADGAANGQLKH